MTDSFFPIPASAPRGQTSLTRNPWVAAFGTVALIAAVVMSGATGLAATLAALIAAFLVTLSGYCFRSRDARRVGALVLATGLLLGSMAVAHFSGLRFDHRTAGVGMAVGTLGLAVIVGAGAMLRSQLKKHWIPIDSLLFAAAIGLLAHNQIAPPHAWGLVDPSTNLTVSTAQWAALGLLFATVLFFTTREARQTQAQTLFAFAGIAGVVIAAWAGLADSPDIGWWAAPAAMIGVATIGRQDQDLLGTPSSVASPTLVPVFASCATIVAAAAAALLPSETLLTNTVAYAVLIAIAGGLRCIHNLNVDEQVREVQDRRLADVSEAEKLGEAGAGVMRWSPTTGQIFYENERFWEIFGDQSVPSQFALHDRVHPDDQQEFLQGPFLRIRTNEDFTHRCRIIGGTTSETRWVEMIAKAAADEVYVLMVNDVTDEVSARDQDAQRLLQLEHQATHDPLTGLPNRALLTTRLSESLRLSSRHDDTPYLLFIDLDGFKIVNDSHGHEAGDAMLITVAQRLLEVARDTDTVARLGGDEFVMLLHGVPDVEAISAIAERVRKSLGRTVPFRKRSLQVGVSIGVAALSSKVRSGDEALRRADEAMYEAKSAGKNRVVIGLVD